MGFLSFIKTKYFFIHASLAMLTATLFLWAVFAWAASYTKHNQTIKVPDFTNIPVSELENFSKDKKIRYQIIDSIYNPQEKPGVVIRQDPEKNSEVKENRTIYLYINSVLPPQIEMPKLVDKSMRQALAMIESYGLKAKVVLVTNDCKNCVVKQLFKGKEIQAGTLIQKGSVIEIQVGKGDNPIENISSPTNNSDTSPSYEDDEIIH
jgi:beta-lactam-binding protein with PASTA domain